MKAVKKSGAGQSFALHSFAENRSSRFPGRKNLRRARRSWDIALQRGKAEKGAADFLKVVEFFPDG
jgi:hypothetical protein